MRPRSRSSMLLVALLLAAAPAVVGPPGATAVSAAPVVVDTTADTADAAPGDGVCADTGGACSLRAAIQEANGAGGAVRIDVPAGTYPIGDPLVLTGEAEVVGAGPGATVLAPATDPDGPMVVVTASARLEASGLTVDGAASGGRNGIEAHGDATVVVGDTAMHDLSIAVFAVEGSDGVHLDVTGSTFTDVDYPVFVLDGSGQEVRLAGSQVTRSLSALYVVAADGRYALVDTAVLDAVGAGLEVYAADEAVAGGADVTVRGVQVTGPETDYGLYVWGDLVGGEPAIDVTVVDTALVDNGGEGLFVDDATLVLDGVTVSGNQAGGGLVSSSSATIRSSSFVDNAGPGLDLDLLGSAFSAEIENTTISGNTGYTGLGLYVDTATLRNVTITDNGTSTDDAGVVVEHTDGATPTVAVHNTVVTANAGADCDLGHWTDPVLDDVASVDGDGTCFGGTGAGDDVGLAPLSASAPRVHDLLPGSPLVDAGDDAVCATDDQRGAPRPQDGDGDGWARCDVGAVEVPGTTGGDDPTDPDPELPADPGVPGDDEAPEAPATRRARRVAGTTRITTAIATSRAAFADGAASAVVLARADDFPDALAGVPFAAMLDAPLLLTPPTTLDDAVAAEIDRVLAADGVVHLLGGTDALGRAVARALADDGHGVQRHGGATRFDTAIAIADAMPAPAAILLVTGTDFPDALTAGAAAAATGGVLALTDGSAPSPATAAFLARHGDVPRYAIGGAAADAHPDADRIVGATRIETALAVADRLFGPTPTVGLARADAFPDALAGGVHAARHGAPMLLTASDRLPGPVATWLRDRGEATAEVFVYGGPAAITDDVLAEVDAATSPVAPGT